MLDDAAAEVLYAVDEGVATITLNAPQRMNTISRTMLSDLGKRLLQADADEAVRCVILTGAGRMFCAGLDLVSASSGTGIASSSDAQAVSTTLDLKTAPPTVLYNMETPTICALNGAAAGYGMDTALGCDIRIMAQSAKLAAAFTKRGIVPESGGTWYLPRLVGWAKAAEIIYTAKTLSADECLELGLANHVLPDDEMLPFAQKLAAEIAANAPLAVQSSKRLMRMGMSEPFNEHVHHVYLQFLQLIRTEDSREGIKSFLEKRPPVFVGR